MCLKGLWTFRVFRVFRVLCVFCFFRFFRAGVINHGMAHPASASAFSAIFGGVSGIGVGGIQCHLNRIRPRRRYLLAMSDELAIAGQSVCCKRNRIKTCRGMSLSLCIDFTWFFIEHNFLSEYEHYNILLLMSVGTIF